MRTVAILSVLALAACSSNGAGNGAASEGGSGSGATTAASGGIDVTDACAALPRDEVQQAIGLPLQSAELKDAMTDSASGMAGSQCAYDFGEARLVLFNLQRLPDGADAAAAQAGGRDLQSEGGKTAIEDVPGLGQNAFYVPSRQTLSVQIDGKRTALLSLYRLPNVADPKGKLIAFARRAIG